MHRLAVIACALALGACQMDVPEGLRRTPPGSGPLVRFDPDAKPLPEIPFPNDLATRADASSATGRRINASLIAPTRLEATVRAKLDRLDGFGTLAPITVSFDGRLDIGALVERHQENTDFEDDAVFLLCVDERSPDFGKPVMLDMGRGNYPLALRSSDRYFDADARAQAGNLLFETVEEDLDADGELDPGEDSDDDGVLDHPNVYPPGASALDGLLTFYEYETDTLILRPVLPLRERTTYAVVLTSRLRDETGRPVRSPFPYVHHLDQTRALEALEGILPPLGLGVGDVAFAWTFTTQSVTADLVAVREGLHGYGPLAWLGERFSTAVEPLRCKDENQDPPYYLLEAQRVVDLALLIGPSVFGGQTEEIQPLIDTFDHVDYLVCGAFTSPDFLRTGEEADPHAENFDLDLGAGKAELAEARIPFMAAVPKATDRHQPPFPVIVYAHGYGSARFEAIGFAGFMARQGIATVGIDAWGHGLPVEKEHLELIDTFASSLGLSPFAEALLTDRARDLDRDGTKDSGGDFWSAYGFHTRDVVRQTLSDYFQLVRVLRGFDGASRWDLDQDGDGQGDLAGDFNADGRVDFGGPDVAYYSWGQSMGGIHSALLGPLEPAIVATAPGAGGGGLADVGMRTMLSSVERAVLLLTMGPLVVGVPAGEGRTELRLLVPLGNERRRLVIGHADSVQPGDGIRLRNLDSGEERTAAVRPDGQFRISMPADTGDRFELELSDAHGEIYARVDTWEQDAYYYDSEIATYAAGEPLATPAEGYGLARCTPDLRRMVGLFQMTLERADPACYARHYFAEPLPIRPEGPTVTNMLEIVCLGDQDVPVNTQIAIARSAGLIGILEDDPRYGMPVNDWLIANHVYEGLSGVGRFPAPDYLFDPDNLDETSDGYDAPEPAPGDELRVVVETPTGQSGVRFGYVQPTGQHGFYLPEPDKPFDVHAYLANLVAWYFGSGGRQIVDDLCLEDGSCALP
ncbi:MAG: hypothetical protein JXR96_26060 [Deltaproteobacteria bacterium]|nr:hypothetical protein [Deltaproteobacteria bacterium]